MWADFSCVNLISRYKELKIVSNDNTATYKDSVLGWAFEICKPVDCSVVETVRFIQVNTAAEARLRCMWTIVH